MRSARKRTLRGLRGKTARTSPPSREPLEAARPNALARTHDFYHMGLSVASRELPKWLPSRTEAPPDRRNECSIDVRTSARFRDRSHRIATMSKRHGDRPVLEPGHPAERELRLPPSATLRPHTTRATTPIRSPLDVGESPAKPSDRWVTSNPASDSSRRSAAGRNVCSQLKTLQWRSGSTMR